MSNQIAQGIFLEDVLAEDLKEKTLELPLTKHLILRIRPQDWVSGVLNLAESVFIKQADLQSLKTKIRGAIK